MTIYPENDSKYIVKLYSKRLSLDKNVQVAEFASIRDPEVFDSPYLITNYYRYVPHITLLSTHSLGNHGFGSKQSLAVLKPQQHTTPLAFTNISLKLTHPGTLRDRASRAMPPFVSALCLGIFVSVAKMPSASAFTALANQRGDTRTEELQRFGAFR